MLVLYLLSRELFFFYLSQLRSLWKPLCPAVKRSTSSEVKQQLHKDMSAFVELLLFSLSFCLNEQILGARSKVSLEPLHLKHIDFIGFIDVLKLLNSPLEGINSAYG